MINMPAESRAYGLQIAEQKKADADNRIQNSAHNIIRLMLFEVFSAGYARALQDHGITPEIAQQKGEA